MSNDTIKDTCFIGIENSKVVVISNTVNEKRADLAGTLVFEVPVAVGREVFGRKVDVWDFSSKYGEPVLVRANELTIVFKFDDIDKCPEDLKPYLDLHNDHNGVSTIVSYEGNMHNDLRDASRELDELTDELGDRDPDEFAVDRISMDFIQEMHQQVALYGKDPAEVLDDLFRSKGLCCTNKAVAA